MGPLSLSKNPGVDKGPQPLMFNPALTTCAANPQKALAQQGFPCIRCWPRHRRKHRMKKLKKVAFSHFFDTLKRLQGASFKSVIKYFIRRVFVAEFVSKLFSYGKGA